MPFTEKTYKKYVDQGYFVCKYCDQLIDNPYSLNQKVCKREACKKAHHYNIRIQKKLRNHAIHSLGTARSFGNNKSE